MKYKIRVNKQTRYIKVYKVLKKANDRTNAVTKLFIRLMGQHAKTNGKRG